MKCAHKIVKHQINAKGANCMKKILSSGNTPYNYSHWDPDNITKVFAGNGAVMAITRQGYVEQCVADSRNAIYNRDWESIVDISDISISKYWPGLTIGLTSTGACVVAKQPFRYIADYYHTNFNSFFSYVNDQKNDWHDLVQVVASDAFFSLDRRGNTDYIAFDAFHREEYRGVLKWRNIARIKAGLQDSIFGITYDGKVLADGANCVKGLNKYLKDFDDVVDLTTTGSECETVILLHRDGSLSDLKEHQIAMDAKFQSLDSYFDYTVIGLTTDNKLLNIVGNRTGTLVFSERVSSFAMDSNGYIIALACDEQPLSNKT